MTTTRTTESSGVGLALIFVLTLLSIAGAAEPMRMTVPKETKPPTLDGKLAPGEWDNAAATTGVISQFDGIAHPRQATFWISFDDQHVHVAQRSTVMPEELKPRTPQNLRGMDSSYVVALAPGRINRGDISSHYVIRTDITDKVTGPEVFWMLKGVKVTYPNPNWAPKDISQIETAQTIENGVWVGEMAIPLKTIKVTDLKDGETWGLLFARDYSAADQNAIVISSDWRFGPANRHYGLGFQNHYRLEKEYATATLSNGSPAVQLLSLGDLVSGRIAPRLAVKNTGDADRELTFRFVHGGKTATKRVTLKPEARQVIDFDPVTVPDKITSMIELSVVDSTGTELFRQGMPVKAGFYRNRAHSVPDLYFSGTHFGGKRANNILLPTGYDPIHNSFYGRLRVGDIPEAHLVERVEVTVRREGESKPVATLTPKSQAAPDVQLGFHDQSYGYRPATVLEWLCPEDGVVDINMEGAHWYQPTESTDGEAMQVLHVSGGVSKVLIPRQVFRKSKEWKAISAEKVKVKKGDKIQFYYDKNGHEGCDDFRMRGNLTHEGIATRHFNPAGELNGKQGGTSGAWFYRYDDDATPNPDGAYRELKWQTQNHWFNWVGWMKFWPKEPKRHMALMRKVVVGGGEMIVDEGLPELSPGVYQAEASAFTKDGCLLARARQNFIRYDHGKDLPWIGNQLGVSYEILKPWVAITAKEEVVSCWGRDYRIDGSGFFSGVSVMSESGLNHNKRQILASPIRVEADLNGKTMVFTAAKKPGTITVSPTGNEASWTGRQRADRWVVEGNATMEYDGYVENRIRITPPAPGTKVERMRLVIPLKPACATHLHAAAGEWFRSTVSSIALGRQDGILWHSGQNHGGGVKPYGNGFGRLMTAGNFKPYVWVGSAHRGIAFMADNDRGWGPDETNKTSAIEVVRKDGQVHLVLNLVARAFAFDKPREITFSLQATPVKPMQDDFRFRRKKLTMASAFTGGLRDKGGWTWCGGMFNIDDGKGKGGKTWLFGLPASPPYRVNWDIAQWYQKEADKGGFHGKDWVNTPYQSLQNVHNFPEVDDPRMPPGKQAANTYGYIFPNMSHGHLEHGNPITAQSDMDYRLYQYNNWIKQVGLQGMYFDQTEPVLTKNPKNGFGYVMDLHDRPNLNGKIQPGYRLTRVRQFYKRLRTIFVEHGVDFPYIWVHSTDANMVGAFAFTDTLLEGENNPRISESHPWMSEKIPPTRMQAVHNSAGKWGLNMTQLPMIDGTVNHHKHPMHNVIKRCWQGYMMLHDVDPHEGEPKWPGLDLRRRADFLPYWDPAVAAALSTGHDQVFASAWRQDDKLIVLVFNRTGDDRSDLTLRAIPEALQIAPEGSNKYVVVDAEEDKELKCTIDDRVVSVTLPVKARNYRMVRFEQHSPDE